MAIASLSAIRQSKSGFTFESIVSSELNNPGIKTGTTLDAE
ncbi:hypothetical protein [Novipirellula herctigrandis]